MRARQLLIALGLSIGFAAALGGAVQAEQTFEPNTNRGGGDYKNFVVEPSIAATSICQGACTSDPNCRAWTFVNSGIQGPKAHCWLKNTVPRATADKCCTSGVSGVISGLEFDGNRPFSDYRNFGVGNADLRDQPELACRAACDKEDQCKAWSYVRGAQRGVCWLKNAVPALVADKCCISGVKSLKPIKTTGKRKDGSTTTGGGGTTTPSSQTPADWQPMLKAHNDFRAQHCSPPLQWDSALASAAQAYANTCPDGHGASNENLAAAWGFMNGVDKQPALSDPDAFTNTWSCEGQFYKYDSPKICPGFKGACNEPKAECGGNPVTGHFTQVVWKSATKLGCGRAKCPFKDGNGATHQGTKWVCRYDTGNTNSPDALKANVLPTSCK